MKRTAAWSHGILLVMVGIVFTVIGILVALVLPMRGLGSWSLAVVGVATIAGGALTAHRAAPMRDRSLPANEKRLPSARALKRR